MPTSVCTVANGEAEAVEVEFGTNVTTGEDITVALSNSTGIRHWRLRCLDASDGVDIKAFNAALEIENFATTFEAPEAGAWYLFESQAVATDGYGIPPVEFLVFVAEEDGVQVEFGSNLTINLAKVRAAQYNGTTLATGSAPGLVTADMYAARLQKKTVTIDATVVGDTDSNGVAATVNVGTALPTGAVVVGAAVTVDTLFSGGALASATLDVGVSGTAGAFITGMDVFTGADTGVRTGDFGTAPTGCYSGLQVIATLDPDNGEKISAATAGSVTIDVFYFVAF